MTVSAQEKIDSKKLKRKLTERICSKFKREFTAKLKNSGSG